MAADWSVRLAAAPEPPRSLSPTSASTWAQCQLKYVLAYLSGWQEPATMPQLVGNVVHRAVELLYGQDRGQRTRAFAGQLLRDALAEELPKPTYSPLVGAGDPTAEVLATGDAALNGLFELEDPQQVTVGLSGLEVWVEAELYGAPVRGRIDRIYDASGAEVVADYKTGKVAKPRFVEKAFFGLWTYVAALAAADPDGRLADRIELLYLVGRERLSRPVLRQVALEQAKTLARTWRAIGEVVADGTPEVLARKSNQCDWCAFKPACPAHQRHLPAVGTPGHDAKLTELGLTQRSRRDAAVALERLEQAADVEDDEGAA